MKIAGELTFLINVYSPTLLFVSRPEVETIEVDRRVLGEWSGRLSECFHCIAGS